ncbi:hypothetical protein BRC81_09665 [Halobacteriales archaeon QS_1_68_20]|nr:MAG: hypothetical protein BRC81_09665 [Halobacteriales archaeon QS_1_68_20]
MDGNNETNRKELLDGTTDGPFAAGSAPPRRGLLKGTVASAAAVVGLPLIGSTGARADDHVNDEYAQPERVQESADANEGLFDAMNEIGLTEGAWSGGLQVKVFEVDGEEVPEHRIYEEADHGMISTVVSVVDTPLGGSAHVITDPDRMETAPFEWPSEKVSELPDGRLAFRVTPDGWADPVDDFEETDEEIPYLECVYDNMVSCAPTSLPGIDCEYVSCCGAFHSDCNAELKEPCEADEECERACWQVSGECGCLRKLTDACS